MRFVQISDTHIVEEGRLVYRAVDANNGLRKAVKRINDMSPSPDFVVCTGDLTNRAREEQYKVFAEIVSGLTVPLFAVPGNHDTPTLMSTFLSDSWEDPKGGGKGYVRDQDGVRLVFLNSILAGEPHGCFDAERRDWLQAKLEEASGHVLVFLHHPPFETGIWWMDAMGLIGASDFEELVRSYPNIRGVFAGHIHRPIVRNLGSVPCWVAPSTSHQVALDIRDDDELFLSENFEPAGMLVHDLDLATGDLTTHIQYCDLYDEIETVKAYVAENKESLRERFRRTYRQIIGREAGT